MEEGGSGDGKARGLCFASEARNPQKPVRLLMSCHTPSTPSCHATTSVTLHGNNAPTPPLDPYLDNVRRCYIRERWHQKSLDLWQQ